MCPFSRRMMQILEELKPKENPKEPYAIKHANYKDLSNQKMNIENSYALLTSNPTKFERKKV